MTQELFAERHGVSVGHVRRIEAGENLGIEYLVKIANFLRVPVVALFGAPRDRTIRLGRPPRARR